MYATTGIRIRHGRTPETVSGHGLVAELHAGRAAVATLGPEWNELLDLSSARSVFLSWEWTQTWLDCVRPRAELRVVTLRDARGRLVALAPFYVARLRFLGLYSFRCLRVMGDAGCGAEYADVITSPREPRALPALLGWLKDRADLWDVLWLPGTGPDAEPAARFQAAAEAAGLHCRTRPREFARISLPRCYSELLARLPAKVRYQTRRGCERLLAEHGATLRTAGPADFSACLSELRRLHTARWQARGLPGAFVRPYLDDFYRELARRLLPRGGLRLDLACVGGTAVAAQIGLVHGDTFSELQRGFAVEFANLPGGVGAALRALVLQRCIAEGLRTYDFLGGCAEHKLRAGAELHTGRDLFVFRRAPASVGLYRSGTWPTGRYLQFVPPDRPAPGQRIPARPE